ncbi:SMC-Scp complex subunit ScpB [Candidatus Woesearchaeota archaeon]|nr:SMC-Scp complex subunit ScpB [Candidatus Woesearchaeota archaeon]
MSNLKYKLEALLFSSARSMKVEELSSLTKASPEEVRETLNELKKDYEQRESSIALIDEGDAFKLNVKPEHISVIQQIVTETELSKTVMETLAVIAFKYPIKQSDLIKIRTNKAYDHLHELEEMGYITRQKYGRTKLIKLTPKFFEYFDLPPEKLKEKFDDFGGIAKAIQEKEEEVKKIKDDMKKKAKEEGRKEKKEGKEEPEIDLVDEKGNKQELEVYEKRNEEVEEEGAREVRPYKETVEGLEVTDVPEKKEDEEEENSEESFEEIREDIRREEGEEEKEEEPPEEEEGIEAEEGVAEEPPEEGRDEEQETERNADKRVEEMLHPETAENGEGSEEEQKEEEQPYEESDSKEDGEGEPKDLLDADAEEEDKEKEEEQEEKKSDEDEPKDLLDADAEEEEKKEKKKNEDISS